MSDDRQRDLKIKVIDFRGPGRTDEILSFNHHGPYLETMRELMSPKRKGARSEVTRTVVRIYPENRELFDAAWEESDE